MVLPVAVDDKVDKLLLARILSARLSVGASETIFVPDFALLFSGNF